MRQALSCEHGGDIYRHRVRLDFSVNVNPLGAPEPVQRAIAEAARHVDAYPDPQCQALREALARRLGIGKEQLIFGNGAAQLIFLLAAARGRCRALLPTPCFGEYQRAAEAAGCTVDFFPLSPGEGYALPPHFVHAIDKKTGLVMLGHPNNPTGLPVQPALLRQILQRCRQTGSILLLDECFIELTDPSAADTLLPCLRPGDPVLLLRAFTKLYGMAGARLGYGVCKNPDILAAMERRRQPWSVSSLAQAGGLAALTCEDFLARTRLLLAQEKEFLQRGLNRLGLPLLPGRANFLLFFGRPDWYERLLARGILIRRCGGFQGLPDGSFRVAVRTRAENQELLQQLQALQQEDAHG